LKRILLILTVAACFSMVAASPDDIGLAPPDAVLVDLANASVSTSLTNLCLDPASNVKDCWIGFITISNTTASPITLLAQDGQGTPYQLIPSAAIPANTSQSGSWQPSGLKMTGGLRVQAGGAGLHLYLHAKRAR
jgi:hypothetical protein